MHVHYSGIVIHEFDSHWQWQMVYDYVTSVVIWGFCSFVGKFASLLHKFWSGQVSLLHPADFKKTVGTYHPQFRDHRQVSMWLVTGLIVNSLLLHPFNGPLSGTTRMSRYQKGKPIWILLKQETVSGSGISWAICKSAPLSRQITMPVPHHSVFYRPDALPATQQTASKHWRPNCKL